MNRQLQQLENAMAQAVLFEIVISSIVIALLFMGLYYAIRAGIRDGLRDAQLDARHRSYRKPPELSDGLGKQAPDMRVD